MIPKDELVKGAVYRAKSRNLAPFVVYSGSGGFIGIREKFNNYFLDVEFLNDPEYMPFSTCTPLERAGEVPAEIEVRERMGTVDTVTGRPVAFDKPVANGGKGWYFTDTGEPDQAIRAASKQNDALFAFIAELCWGVDWRAEIDRMREEQFKRWEAADEREGS